MDKPRNNCSIYSKQQWGLICSFKGIISWRAHFSSLFFPINFNRCRTSVTWNVMGQEDGWVHLKPLVTGQKASWQSDTGSTGFNNGAWTILSKWNYSATWFGIFSLGKILSLSLFIIFLQVRLSKTFSFWTWPNDIFKSGKYINLGTKRSFGDKLEWPLMLRTSNYFIKKVLNGLVGFTPEIWNILWNWQQQDSTTDEKIPKFPCFY